MEKHPALAHASVWISLDTAAPGQSPPPGIFWLQLAEEMLKAKGWRNTLALLAKLLPALHVTGACQLLTVKGDALRHPLHGSLLLLLARQSLVRKGLHYLLRLVSPKRATRLLQQRQDKQGLLAALMDADYYLKFPAPIAPGVTAIEHYLYAGQYADLAPHPLFWPRHYVEQFPDSLGGLTPWHLFVNVIGDPNPFFSTSWYLKQADAGKHHSHPLLDMLAHHARGTRAPDPNPLFDQAWYIDHYHCRETPPLVHFLAQGADHPTCDLLARHPEIIPDHPGGRGLVHAFSTAFANGPSTYPAFPAKSVNCSGNATLERTRVAVCCVMTGNYDIPRPIRTRLPRADYFLLTDRQSTAVADGWQILCVPSLGMAPLLFSRYLKMHLADLLPDVDQYQAVLYVDANIEIIGDILPLITPFLGGQADMAVIPHPFRRTVYEEAAAVMLQMRAARETVRTIVAQLEEHACPAEVGLFEMNLFCFRRTPLTARFFAMWWELYHRHAGRDQLLAPLAAWQAGLTLEGLMPAGQSARTHPALAFHAHRNASARPKDKDC